MTPTDPQACRQSYLEALYHRSGRHRRDHPMHSLYTGLLQARAAELVEFDVLVTVGEVGGVRPCVFMPLLALAILAGQVIAILGSRYLDCVDAHGPKFCNEYISDRLPWGKP